MPTTTYDLLASSVLTGSASTITFSSIPSTYRDLVVVCSLSVSTTSQLEFRFNNDASTIYSTMSMAGSGSVAESGHSSNQSRGFLNYFQSPATTQANMAIMQVLDYSATNKHKPTLVRLGAASRTTELTCTTYASTNAINRLDIFRSADSYLAGTTVYLYGIVS